MIKVCTKCNLEKEESEFSYKRDRKKDRLRSECNACLYIRRNSKRHLVKDRVFEYKSSLKCSHCGFVDARALTFHHKDPSSKLFEISSPGNRNFDAVMKEISKCEVLCANCHYIEHSLRGK